MEVVVGGGLSLSRGQDLQARPIRWWRSPIMIIMSSVVLLPSLPAASAQMNPMVNVTSPPPAPPPPPPAMPTWLEVIIVAAVIVALVAVLLCYLLGGFYCIARLILTPAILAAINTNNNHQAPDENVVIELPPVPHHDPNLHR